MKQIRILELFGGIGACTQALKRLDIPFEVADYVEIDKYAVKSYNAINSTNFEPQDITKWDKDIEVDFLFHGSPCQDFSVAGLGKGGDEGTGTRSSLMYETIRIVEKLKPKYVIWENVKNVISKKHKHNFDNYINRLNELGYNSYYQVLNAKDYGTPQNRERVFTVSIRKDIDNGSFKFPEKEELKLRLKDLLQNEVDEKYYLNDTQIDRIKTTSYHSGEYNQRVRQMDGICNTLTARDYKDPKCVQVGNLKGGKWDKINESCRRVYSDEGISPTIHTCQGGNTEPKIEESLPGAYGRNFGSKGKVQDLDNICDTLQAAMGNGGGNVPTIKIKQYERTPLKFLNRNQKNIEGDYSFCIDSSNTGGVKEISNKVRIRKLTPKECWRLMDFDDECFEKAKNAGMSNTQLYKQAGNSIVVGVLERILRNLFKEYKNE